MYNLNCKNNFKAVLLSLLLINTVLLNAQKKRKENKYDNVIKEIRTFNFSKSNDVISKLPIDNKIKEEFRLYNSILKEYAVYKDSSEVEFKKVVVSDSDYHKTLALLNEGLHTLLYKYDEESKALKALNKALEMALVLKNKPLVCEITRTILLYYKRLFSIKENTYKYYLEIYKNNVYDILENQIYTVVSINLSLYRKDYNLSSSELKELEIVVKEIPHDYYKVKALLTLSIYYENYIKDYKKASEGFFDAYQISSKYNSGIYIEQAYASQINSGICLRRSQKYLESIKLLNDIVETHKGKSIDWVKNFKHISLSKAYEALGQYDKAHAHLDSSRVTRNRFNQKESNIVASKLQIEHEVKNKDRKIDTLSYKNKTLTTKLMTLTPFILIFALAALIFFYFYKRYKSRSKVLEAEQSETLQKLDELKKIVIKNHIILKDKTKVYIADLMYIKSDDHYLNIFLSDSKNHFVRGKLNAITEELPPNFIRCHRSYIVNRNFIKQINSDTIILIDKTQIPLSRSYKDKF